jgi:hypothetical protein
MGTRIPLLITDIPTENFSEQVIFTNGADLADHQYFADIVSP